MAQLCHSRISGLRGRPQRPQPGPRRAKLPLEPGLEPLLELQVLLVASNVTGLHRIFPLRANGSNDGPDEADAAIAAIQSVTNSAGLDPRIVFAMVMQESSGKVRPIIGDNGLSFGLMQVQNSAIPLCNDYAKNECPADVITTQIEFGVFGHEGTGSPVAPGIAYWLGAEGGDIGRALRGYNTGNVPDPNDLTNAGAATKSYVSDVANRLTGALVGAQHQATCT
ncbi:MAG: hypothetical protein Q9223_004086 [Gallowayella weberi]